MANDVILSILVTFSNQKEFIKDALNSIFSQNVDFEYEVLIGLDGEDKESEKIIDEYVKRHPRTKLYKIDNTKINTINIEKASKNRLNLLEHAAGKYICFLDGDDYYLSTARFQKMINILEEKKEFIGVFHDFSFLDNTTKTQTPRRKLSSKEQSFTAQEYLKIKHTQFSCFIFRNIFYGKIPRDLNVNFVNDTTLVYYFLRYGKFYYIPEHLLAYRVNINSIFASKSSRIKKLYTLLCGEINHQTLPQYEGNLCKKYKKILIKVLKDCIRNHTTIQEDSEIKLISNVAEKENCYFTYSLINFTNMCNKEKFLLLKKLISYIILNKYPMKFRVKSLKYFSMRSNFGDELNLYILQRLTNINVYSPQKAKGDLYAIGSILQTVLGRKRLLILYRKKIIVWGTGFIKPPTSPKKKESFKRFAKILALRGKLTKTRVQKIVNSNLSDIVLGDPGLLCSKLISQENITKKYRIGIIPHYIDSKSNFQEKIDLKDFKIIDITENPMYLLQQIAECEVIFSSSLHGLIAADSLNIPNCWLKISDKLIGKDYKFRDYYSVFDIEEPKYIDLMKQHLTNDDVENVIKNYPKDEYKSKIEDVNEKLLECSLKI